MAHRWSWWPREVIKELQRAMVRHKSVAIHIHSEADSLEGTFVLAMSLIVIMSDFSSPQHSSQTLAREMGR